MKIKTIWLLVFCWATMTVLGQSSPHKIDSLLVLLKNNIADSTRVHTLVALAEEQYTEAPNKATNLIEQAKIIAEKNPNPKDLTVIYGWLAYLYEQQGHIKQAIYFYSKSLKIAQKNKNIKDQGTILNNLAAIYKDQGKILEALNYHNKSLALKKEIGDRDGISTSYNNIGLIYASQGKIKQALNYYQQSLKIEEDLQNPEGIATALGNIAAVYKDQREYDKAREYLIKSLQINTKSKNKYGLGYALNSLGLLYQEIGNPNVALEYFQQSLSTRRQIQDRQGIAYSQKNLGNLYKNTGNLAQAEKSFKESLQNFEFLGDQLGMAAASNLLGEVLKMSGKNAEAEQYFNQSLKMAQSLGYPINISQAAKNLQLIYREKGQWKDALAMNDLYVQMKDSVMNDQNRNAAIKAQFKYDFEQKERLEKLARSKQLAQEERHRNIQYALIALGILILIVLFLLFSHTIVATPGMIRFVGVITLLIVFEFINLLAHPFLEKITHHSTLMMLLAMVSLASLLVPMHHKIEKWATTALIEKNKKVRLANAQKTIEELQAENTAEKNSDIL